MNGLCWLVVPWCVFCLVFHRVLLPQTYCVFLYPIFMYTKLLLGDSLASKSWEWEMYVFYRKYKDFCVNCNSLKNHLKNYPSPTCSLSHWAQISLCFMGFKYRMSLSPSLICCCIGKVFTFFCLQRGLLENSGQLKHLSRCGVKLGLLWTLTYNFLLRGIPLSLCSGEQNSTSESVTGWIINWESKAWPHLFEWSCANLHQWKYLILMDNLQLIPTMGK